VPNLDDKKRLDTTPDWIIVALFFVPVITFLIGFSKGEEKGELRGQQIAQYDCD